MLFYLKTYAKKTSTPKELLGERGIKLTNPGKYQLSFDYENMLKGLLQIARLVVKI